MALSLMLKQPGLVIPHRSRIVHASNSGLICAIGFQRLLALHMPQSVLRISVATVLDAVHTFNFELGHV